MRHFREHSDSRDPDETRHIFSGHSGSGERHSWKLQSIRRSPCPQKCHTASIKYKQLRILKMATRFIAYDLKLMKEKYISKSLCKSTLKEFGTSNNNQSIKRNPLPVRVSAMESDSLTQKVNRDDRIMIEGTLTHYIYHCQILMRVESLTEICRSSDSGDRDEDDTYFPTVQELIARQGMSRGHAPKAVDKPALDNNDRSINPDKSILGPNSGNSQGEYSSLL